mmetsp:Transcript_27634/g.64481  ORF Transcript_27634/g.64481 Transcript_27634/m.64481 type:complete len:259 (-) Transcript_27634:372-1148(-)
MLTFAMPHWISYRSSMLGSSTSNTSCAEPSPTASSVSCERVKARRGKAETSLKSAGSSREPSASCHSASTSRKSASSGVCLSKRQRSRCPSGQRIATETTPSLEDAGGAGSAATATERRRRRSVSAAAVAAICSSIARRASASAIAAAAAAACAAAACAAAAASACARACATCSSSSTDGETSTSRSVSMSETALSGLSSRIRSACLFSSPTSISSPTLSVVRRCISRSSNTLTSSMSARNCEVRGWTLANVPLRSGL